MSAEHHSPRLARAVVALAAAGVLLTLVPGLVGPYGPFIDELYYVSCSERPAAGYVDHPPLAPLLLRLSRPLLGDGLLALRLPVAAAFGGLILLVGWLAGQLGARAPGQTIASASALGGGLLLAIFGFYSMNAFEVLLWAGLTATLVEIERRDEPRLWLVFGSLAGLALLNKHTVVLLAAALAVGVVVTPARRHLRSPWLWAGAALAGLLFLPNLLWQVSHGWPSLEFYRNASQLKQTRLPPLDVAFYQAALMSPGTLPVWGAGLLFLLRRGSGDRPDLRHLGVAYLVLLAVMMATGESRPDRMAGAYPMLMAAGGVALERRLGTRARAALFAWIALWGALLAPVGLPLLPPETAARWSAALGVVPQLERGEGKRTQLPQLLADRLGWEKLIDDVARVRDALPPAERDRVVFFAPSYGQASALDWLGRDLGLDRVYSAHNNWFLWGPPAQPVEVAIVIGNDRERLESVFEEVERALVHDCGLCMPWRDEMPIWVARRPRRPIAELWPEMKFFF